MLQIAVCDDEKRMRDYLEGLILSENKECQVTKFASGAQLLLEKSNFDILLLDIGMDELNGIETAKRVRKSSDATIIFITALKEYVFEAFDVEAFHYILKPVDEDKFKEIFGRAVKGKKGRLISQPLMIKTDSGYQNILREAILYAENQARKIILHTINGNIAYYAKMSDLEVILGTRFFRCHRGYLVNLEEVNLYDMNKIQLKNGEEIYMAKRKYHEFVSAYMNFLRRK